MLLAAATLSFAIALLHFIMIFVGAPAYEFFDAGSEMVELAASGSPWPALITLLLTVGFVVFGLYAFSGAGRFRRMPLLRPALVAIAAIYTLRGLVVVPEALGRIEADGTAIIFSAVSLVIGLAYAVGIVQSWPSLAPGNREESAGGRL